MRFLRSQLTRCYYRYGWDFRCRNKAVAALLRKALGVAAEGGARGVLDVGSGGAGIGAFLSGIPVVGVDIARPGEKRPPSPFVVSNAVCLPFADQSFRAVTCIDVLEHMPLDERMQAVEELVRVASGTLLLAFPHGTRARECDEAFRSACLARRRPLPPWLDEHLRQTYPTGDSIWDNLRAVAERKGRMIKLHGEHCEPLAISRILRAAATRSNLLYIVANLLLGILMPFIPTPDERSSYRAIIWAEIENAPRG